MILTVDDISFVYSLFGNGLIVGGLLGSIPFIIGYAIGGIFSVIHRNT